MPSRTVIFIAKLGLAFCFLSFGLWELLQPNYWTYYVPGFVSAIVDPIVLVRIHGVVLSLAGLGLILGRYARVFTGLAILIMLEITFSLTIESGFTDILIRDICILFFAVALFVDAWQQSKMVKA